MAFAALPLGPTVFPGRIVAKNSLGFTFNYTLYDGDGGRALYYVRFPKVLFSNSQAPSHVLHNGPKEKDPELASASYVEEDLRIVVITTTIPGRRGATAWRFTPDVGGETAMKNSLHRVTGSDGGEGPEEVFEWKYVKGGEALGQVGAAQGFEMTRRTGGRAGVVAVLGFKAFSVKKRYTFAFLGDGPNLGREFEIMAVMSMIRVEYLFQEAARS